MSSIDELEYYCKLNNPVGALLLTGEWGCGKTYLIDHELQGKLANDCVIIRISLFGIPTVYDLHNAVKQSWIHARGGLIEKASSLEKIKGFIGKASNLIPNKIAKGAIESVLSFNFMDFVEIDNMIDDKKVILVFDDLERSKLSIQEKLGAINEYCENKHFNVIVIADEEKINSSEYKEFKEKIIQRTIKHITNYKGVVDNIIRTIDNENYKNLLIHNKADITALFAGQNLEGKSLDVYAGEISWAYRKAYAQEEIDFEKRKKQLLKSRPHNIRSLKLAIQDFERIYDILEKDGAQDGNKWLFSFIAFTMAAKANLVHKVERYGYLLTGNDMGVLYPGFFDSRFMPDVLKQWIVEGVWNEDIFKDYVKRKYCSIENSSPKDLIKNCRIDYLEEDVAIRGLKDILLDAYAGELSINEYVFLIINSRLARYYNLVKLEIDWGKICSGINKRIENDIQNGEKHELFKETISNMDGFSDEEKRAYQIISDAREKSIIMFESNKREYINEMRYNPYEAFIKISSKRFNYFDEEMADATVEAFKNVDNPTKAKFPSYFEGIWINHSDMEQQGIEKTKETLIYLKNMLFTLKEEYEGMPFKKRYTEAFISVVDGIIDEGKLSEN